MKWRRRKGSSSRVGPAALASLAAPAASADDVALAETIARHFDGASVDGRTAHLGPLGVTIECAVHSVSVMGSQHAAVLHFWLSGARLFEGRAFASVSGYHPSRDGAVIEGGCLWACTLAPVLRVALEGDAPSEDVAVFETVINQRRFQVVVSGLDRTMTTDGPPAQRPPDVRRRLGGKPWLTPIVLASGTMPMLSSQRSLLSVFVGETPAETTTEVKVNGGDWWPANACFPKSPGPIADLVTGIRELAVLTPLDPPLPLSRADIDGMLAGFAMNDPEPWTAAGWMGWAAHGGVLTQPLTESDVTKLEAGVELPRDYRHFLTTVAASGAGPGYGLVPPTVVDDRVVLAHAGCGVTWVLRLDQAHRGEVWVDAAGSDQRYESVAPSFDAWYRSWLDDSVRAAGPWLHWNGNRCATAGVLSEFVDAVERETGHAPTSLADQAKPGVITLTFAGNTIDPCHNCVLLATRFGLDERAFTPGVLRARPDGVASDEGPSATTPSDFVD